MSIYENPVFVIMYQKNLSDISELASSRIYLSQLMPRMTWKNWLFEKFAISRENEVETTWKHHPKLEEHVWHQIRSKKVKNHRRNHQKSQRIQLTGHLSNFVVAILKSKRSQSRKLLSLIIFAWKKIIHFETYQSNRGNHVTIQIHIESIRRKGSYPTFW